jgi:hypothetical protein
MIKRILVSSCLLLLFLTAGLRAQFARTYGTSMDDSPVTILTTSDAGFIVFGNSLFSESPIWALKLAADGTVEWGKAYATPQNETLYSALTAPEGGYLMAGGSSSSLWLLKTDENGEPVWQRSIANVAATFTPPYGLCPAGDSGYFIVGSTNPSADSDAWVIKLSAGGDVIWQKAYGLAGWESGVSAAAAGDGGCVVVGKSDASGQGLDDLLVFHLDAAGAVSWQKTFSLAGFDDFDAPRIRRTSDGGYALTGRVFAGGIPAMFVIKLDVDGTLEWERSYSLAGGFDIQEAADGGFILTGGTGQDILVMKLDAGGAIVWQKAFGGPFLEEGAAVVQTQMGDYAAAGYTDSFGAGGRDLFVIRVSGGGELGNCGIDKRSNSDASTQDVTETVIGLSAQDTTAAIQTVDYAVSSTSGLSQTYHLCALDKVLTISSSLPLDPSVTSPPIGSHVNRGKRFVSISAKASVSIGGDTYNFSGWTGDVSSSATTVTIHISDDVSVRAEYYSVWDGDGDGGGRCFIATAAYRSPLHPAVRMLRRFRDRRLLTNGLGRAFVAAYSRWSPPAARVIASSAPLRLIARVALVPVIAFAFIVLKAGWLVSLLLMAAVTALAVRKVRLRLKGAHS